jgi:uncharacterized protein (TIGR00369 family)
MNNRDLAGSPFNDLIGFEIADWREDHVELGLTLAERHLNRSGVLHGGVLSTLIDVAGGLAGCHCPVEGNVRRALTLSLTVNFTGQTRSGAIRVIGRKRAGGRKVYFASMEVLDDQGTLLALGEGTFRYRRGSESPEGLPAEEAS